MKYQMLGPLRLVQGDRVSSISAPKIELLLAILLIRNHQPIPVAQLIAEVWGDNAPRRANAGLHVYISQLRKILRAAGAPTDPITTVPAGYMLRLGGDELDFLTFQESAAVGREHAKAGRDAEAVATFEQALSLWRGPVLPSLETGPLGYGFATWLDESRLECIEMLMECQLRLGLHRELAGQLYSLTLEHPLREPFYRQLMLALYRSERQADALAVYQRARQTLHEELGLEPCRALQDLQQAILHADDRLGMAWSGGVAA